MDRVYIKNYTVVAKHGYYKEEHAKSQRFVVSVFVECDVRQAGGSDDLKKTLNYEFLRKYIHDVLMESPHNLIESLAEDIAQKVLTHNDVKTVQVDIEKPDVWSDCSPGISITRHNENNK